jgi:hypothetical protein
MASRKRGRHARPSKTARLVTAAGSAAVPGITAGVLLTGVSHPGTLVTTGSAAPHFPYRLVSDQTYIVQPGDDLREIAARFCGNPADASGLAAANRIPDANLIYAGAQLRIDCAEVPGTAVISQPPRPALSGTVGCSQLEDLWEAAGGNPSEAFTAAEIAMAESGGNQYATGTVGERGYWQINPNHGALSTYDPLGNARAAIDISGDGASWTAWTTYTSGAYIGRC